MKTVSNMPYATEFEVIQENPLIRLVEGESEEEIPAAASPYTSTDNFYVPWNTSALTGLKEYITTAIGSSVNIAFPGLILITAVCLVVGIVRHFTRN